MTGTNKMGRYISKKKSVFFYVSRLVVWLAWSLLSLFLWLGAFFLWVTDHWVISLCVMMVGLFTSHLKGFILGQTKITRPRK